MTEPGPDDIYPGQRRRSELDDVTYRVHATQGNEVELHTENETIVRSRLWVRLWTRAVA